MSNVEKTDRIVVSIRKMCADDLPVISELERQIFPDPWSESAFSEALSEEEWGALVAESDGTIIGYACYLIVGDEAHLTNIAVAEPFRRKSVAKQLLDHILRVVTEAECEYLLLEVRPSNTRAIAFYQKHGFHLLYRRPRYYHHPIEDAQVMVLYL